MRACSDIVAPGLGVPLLIPDAARQTPFYILHQGWVFLRYFYSHARKYGNQRNLDIAVSNFRVTISGLCDHVVKCLPAPSCPP